MTSDLLLLFSPYTITIPPGVHGFLSFPAGVRDAEIVRGLSCGDSVGDL